MYIKFKRKYVCELEIRVVVTLVGGMSDEDGDTRKSSGMLVIFCIMI